MGSEPGAERSPHAERPRHADPWPRPRNPTSPTAALGCPGPTLGCLGPALDDRPRRVCAPGLSPHRDLEGAWRTTQTSSP
ncbi:t63 [Tupaiid betaherpesvirus 1]|uniref:T63 n=1 Tax=Tupaiid herpesvirus 1 (strain 1) TaxID=10397 RepID=Q91TN0_TUHV1|nr:t63 [Tupaiid betaherpesvirus 1]AAK57112.1 t63 [Tupaiid betaherpesvirus 1]